MERSRVSNSSPVAVFHQGGSSGIAGPFISKGENDFTSSISLHPISPQKETLVYLPFLRKDEPGPCYGLLLNLLD